MSTATSSQYPTNDTAAHFRAWGLALSNLIQSVGLAKVPCTTQIDWGTVAQPGATSTAMGYEVFKFSDALSPCYILVEYGSSAGNAMAPGIWVTVGTGVNTSTGALTNPGYRGALGLAANSNTDTSLMRVSGNASRLTMQIFPGVSASGPIWFNIERLRDASGAELTNRIIVLFSSASGISTWYGSYMETDTLYYLNRNPYATVPSSGTGVNGNTVYLFPIRTHSPAELAPYLGLSVYFSVDITGGTTFTGTSWEGTTRTYIATNWAGGTAGTSQATKVNSGTVIALLWE